MKCDMKMVSWDDCSLWEQSIRIYLDCIIMIRTVLILHHQKTLTLTLNPRERPIQDLRPMSDDRCCYGNIHRCRYRCRCCCPGSPSDVITADLDQWSIEISCYNVNSAYLPFTFTAKESWEIMLSPTAARLPPVAATADSLVHVIWYTRLPPVGLICALMLGAHVYMGGRV